MASIFLCFYFICDFVVVLFVKNILFLYDFLIIISTSEGGVFMKKIQAGKPVKAVNVWTKETRLFLSMSEMAREFNVSESAIRGYVNGHRKSLFLGKIKILSYSKEKKKFIDSFSYISKKECKKSSYVKKKNHIIIVKNVNNNKVYSFDTMTKVADFFAVMPSTIYQYCRTQKKFKDKYIFSKMS